MDLKIKGMNWMGDIYQKFEAVCQEVDDIVAQDPVKYFENHVQNVGDSMKKFYSGVVHELLPFPTLVSSTEYEAHSMDLKNSSGSSVRSVGGVKDNNKNVDEENPADDQQAAFIKHDIANQVGDETCSDSTDVENYYTTQEEFGDDLIETPEVKETAIESAPKPMNLISVKEKEPLISSAHSESHSDFSDSVCGDLVRTKDNIGVNEEPNSCLVVEENHTSIGEKESTNLSLFSESSDVDEQDKHGVLPEVSPATSSLSCEPITETGSICFDSSVISESPYLVVEENNTSIGEKESTNLSLFSKSSDVDEQDKHGVLPEVLPATSYLSCEPITETGSICFDSSIISESPYSKSLGSYFQTESCNNDSGDGSWSISDSSRVHVCCGSSHVTGQIMESQDVLVSTGSCLSMESNDESLISSLEFCMDDIHLNDDVNLEESCVFVDDSELYAVSCRAQKLRSYKKRIQDAFAPKRRLSKEYEQIAIWYGDTDTEYSQGSSRTVFPFRSMHFDSRMLQEQQASETEWELL